MKRNIFVLGLSVFAGLLCARADDDGDETLKYYLSKSVCVALGTITNEPTGSMDGIGIVTYACDFSVSEVLKGNALTNGVTTRVVVVRWERVELGTQADTQPDRHPLIHKGGKCILFLKDGYPGSIPKLTTADYWFGVQYPSKTMARRLQQLANKHDS